VAHVLRTHHVGPVGVLNEFYSSNDRIGISFSLSVILRKN
jgi:hypothetical protein